MSIDPTGSGAGAYASLAMDATQGNPLMDGRSTSSVDPEEAVRSFEGYLAQLMVKEMRNTLPEGGLLSSQAMDVFMGVFDQEVAARIADGPGLGLAQSLGPALAERSGWSGAALADPESPSSRRWPARSPVDGVITSRFGQRRDPFTRDHRMHDGLDIAAEAGSPVRAVRDGEVAFAGRRAGYGNVVIVDHGEGLQTLYAHCERLNVEPGASVKAGQPIGTVGQTGRATGPHLHFEVRVNGDVVNPEGALRWQ